jgi:magnesium chelatase subunit I
MAITEQESYAKDDRLKNINVSDLVKRLIEQVAMEARNSEMVDKKSGVSARLTISASENAISAAERRVTQNKETKTQVWINDLQGIIPSITGKVELVYEGEQEGPYQVAIHLLDKSIRTLFKQYFPDPDLMKKKKKAASGKTENPYQSIIQWFDGGNHLNLFFDSKDEDKQQMLYKVSGLHALVKQHYPHINDMENALLMEFVLHGLAAHSMINKKMVEGKVMFNDLMGSMLNLGNVENEYREDEQDEDF